MKIAEECVGLLGMHAVVHPDHRRKGMARRLAGEFVAEGAARGLAVVYGLAEDHMRAGVSGVPTPKRRMKDLLLVLNLRRMLSRKGLALLPKLGAVLLRTAHGAKMLPPPEGVRIEQISEFDESFDDLWIAVSSSLGKKLLVKRSRAYLTWRYSRCPESEYLTWVAREDDALLGYVVARHDRTEDSHRGLIADIFGFDHRRDAMGALVSSVVQYLGEQGVELVRSHLSDGHPFTGVLEDVGFVARPSKQWLSLHVLSPAAGVDQAWLLRKENHMIAWGDELADSF
jgi:hypothetical protein